jgi:hypothetical protein
MDRGAAVAGAEIGGAGNGETEGCGELDRGAEWPGEDALLDDSGKGDADGPPELAGALPPPLDTACTLDPRDAPLLIVETGSRRL